MTASKPRRDKKGQTGATYNTIRQLHSSTTRTIMLHRTLHKSFRSTRLVPAYRHHARALFQSNLASLALLTLLFLYSNWWVTTACSLF